jgi:hypothetical protein
MVFFERLRLSWSQRTAQVRKAEHDRIETEDSHVGTVLSGLVESERFIEVLAGLSSSPRWKRVDLG